MRRHLNTIAALAKPRGQLTRGAGRGTTAAMRAWRRLGVVATAVALAGCTVATGDPAASARQAEAAAQRAEAAAARLEAAAARLERVADRVAPGAGARGAPPR
jgi:hypothetical protein